MLDLEARIRGILAGRREDGEWFYDQYAERLYRRLAVRYKYLSTEEVEDIVHDTFLMFLRDDGRVLREFRARTQPEQLHEKTLDRYLWDRACGLVVNLRRSAHHQRVVPISEYQDRDRATNNEARSLSRDLLERLATCLAGVSSRIHLYFRLRYYDGLTPSEIVKVVGWSKKTTYSLRQKFDEALKKCLDQLGLR